MLEARPIVVNPEMVVIGGNMRFKACKAAGLKEAPVYMATWGETKDREFIIKDNVSSGENDFDILANEWDAEELNEWGLDVWTGEPEETEGLTDPDDVPEVPEEAKTKLGDLYILGEHRLLCGDSTKAEDVEKLMNGEKADMVFTDPPYALFGNSTGVAGITDDNMVRPFFRKIMATLKANSKSYAHIYMCCDWHSAFSIESCAREVELKSKNMCIWDKGDGGVGAMYQQCYEIVWFFDNSPMNKTTMGNGKSGVRTVNGKPNIWRYPRVTGERVHNAQKPTEMIQLPISVGSDLNEVVLDLFGGSGSTLMACENLNRKSFLMELDPKYCDVIVKRWEDFTGKKAVKENL
jgi:DNA modification methylase